MGAPRRAPIRYAYSKSRTSPECVATLTRASKIGFGKLLLAAQHVRQLVFTHKLGQRQASVVLAARVV
jgi:hypothetical protein